MANLVTGGTGLLGAHLICELLMKGQEVKAIRRNTSSLYQFNLIADNKLGKDSKSLQNLSWLDCDVLDTPGLIEAMHGVDHVYHCAGLVSFLRRDRDRMLDINQGGTANVVNACLASGISRLCHVSSTSALGPVKGVDDLITEQTEFDPDSKPSFYGLTKHLSELEVLRGSEEGLSTVIINPSVILGFGTVQSGTPRLFVNAWRNFPFYSTGANAFVGVDDVTECMIRLANSELTGRYLCLSENLSFRDVFNAMADEMGKRRPRFKAGKAFAGTAWRVAGVLRMLGINSLLSRESANSAGSVKRYSNQKISEVLEYRFTPVKEVIHKLAPLYAELLKK